MKGDEKMAFCKKCGNEIREGAAFCHSCGFKISDDISLSPEANSILNSEFSSSVIKKVGIAEKIKSFFTLKKCIALLLAIVLVIPVSGLIFYKSDEEKIFDLVNNLGESMTEGDFEKMIECFEPKAQNQMKALMNIGSAIGGNYLGGADLQDLWSLGSIQMADSSNGSKLVFTVHRLEFIDENTAELELSASCDSPSAKHGVMKATKIGSKWYFKEDGLF